MVNDLGKMTDSINYSLVVDTYICPVEWYASRIGYEIAKYDISRNERRLILVYGTKFYVNDCD